MANQKIEREHHLDSSCYLDGWQGSEFTPKGPVFRRNEGQNIRPSPYQEPAKAPKPDVEVIDLGKDSLKKSIWKVYTLVLNGAYSISWIWLI